VLSCNNVTYHYPKNNGIANAQGIPKDSLLFYFTTYEPFDSSQIELVRDTFLQNYVGANLYAFREPIYFNDYLGKEQYRFLWLPSFQKPMLFVLTRENDQVILTTKTLDRHPINKDVRYEHGHYWDQDYIGMGHELIIQKDTLQNGKVQEMTFVKGRYAKIASSDRKILTMTDWGKFKNLLSGVDFWNLQTFIESGATDGAFWAIEANTTKGYKLVLRHMPENKVMRVGQFFVDRSGSKIELY
jgi:hypothetical protein